MDLSNKDMRACEALSITEVFELALGPIQVLSDKGTWVDYTGPLEPQLVLRRKPEEYDWLRNPEKRPANVLPRWAYANLKCQDLEYWSKKLQMWRTPTLRPDESPSEIYRLNPKLDPANPDWIVWGKMDTRVKEQILESDRVQVLLSSGDWFGGSTLDDAKANGVYRIAP